MFISQRFVLGLLIVISVFLFSACSHVNMPRGPIPVTRDVVGSMDVSKAISFENGVPETKLSLIAVFTGPFFSQHSHYADYRLWTDFIVSHLETELKGRGVQVKPDSEEIFRVKVEDVSIYQGAWVFRCIVKVRVEKKNGTWSKTYEGDNPSPASLSRAIDGAVYKAVVAILQDKDFIDVLMK